MPPTDAGAEAIATAAAAADEKAAFATTHLEGLLDTQGLIGNPIDIDLGDALAMRDAAVADREASQVAAAQVAGQALRDASVALPHKPSAPTTCQLPVVHLKPPSTTGTLDPLAGGSDGAGSAAPVSTGAAVAVRS